MKILLYIHGKGGNAAESTHYENLFPDCKVIGLDYKTFSPWETGQEIHEVVVEKQGATLTVMKGGEHWFHTEEEMKFIDEWIRSQK